MAKVARQPHSTVVNTPPSSLLKPAFLLEDKQQPHFTVTNMPPPLLKPASRHLLEDTNKYYRYCVKLSNATTQGDWTAAENIIRQDDTIIRAAITRESCYTVLHIAASGEHYGFMKKLLKLLDKDDLYLLDQRGNAAFCLAVAEGNVRMTKILLEKDPLMAEQLKSAEGWSPLRLATHHGHGKMAEFLYPKTIRGLDKGERVATFFNCIKSRDTALMELALKILRECPELAYSRDTSGATAFHVLAGNPSAYKSTMLNRFLHTCFGKQLKTPGLQVQKLIWEIVSAKDEVTVEGLLTYLLDGKPANALFIAAECGNVKFLEELFASDPALKFEKDDCNRNVFHIGAMHHRKNIFTLVDKLGADKSSILSSVDNVGNTILHLAAKLAKPRKWDKVVGPEIRVKRDLKWFEEVTKVVPPGCLDMKNFKGEKPGDIFIQQHGTLNDHVNKKEMMSWPNLLSTIGLLVAIFSASVAAAAFVFQRMLVHKTSG